MQTETGVVVDKIFFWKNW